MQPPDGIDNLPDGARWLPGPDVEAKVAAIFYEDLPSLNVGRLPD